MFLKVDENVIIWATQYLCETDDLEKHVDCNQITGSYKGQQTLLRKQLQLNTAKISGKSIPEHLCNIFQLFLVFFFTIYTKFQLSS